MTVTRTQFLATIVLILLHGLFTVANAQDEDNQSSANELKPQNAAHAEKINQVIAELEAQMVVIPAGRFLMGEKNSAISVDIPSFKMGKFEVSFAQWDVCVLDGGCRHSPLDRWGRDTHPVIYVTYGDIVEQFLPWLNKKTGKNYRLPSEAEWEYAARAGTTGRFNTGTASNGDCITTDQANFNGTYPDDNCPVGEYLSRTLDISETLQRYQPNAFGLYNMHGNVWEWVEDCLNFSHAGHPGTHSARQDGNCFYRMVRGGSWENDGIDARSSSRSSRSIGLRYFLYSLGFRLAASVDAPQ